MARVLESVLAESDFINANSLFFSVVESDCCGVVVVVDVGDENGGVVVDGDLHGVIMVYFSEKCKDYFSFSRDILLYAI